MSSAARNSKVVRIVAASMQVSWSFAITCRSQRKPLYRDAGNNGHPSRIGLSITSRWIPCRWRWMAGVVRPEDRCAAADRRAGMRKCAPGSFVRLAVPYLPEPVMALPTANDASARALHSPSCKTLAFTVRGRSMTTPSLNSWAVPATRPPTIRGSEPSVV